ncbi:hypothetical protein ACWDCB_40500 [Streptomyces sp. NPDC001178]
MPGSTRGRRALRLRRRHEQQRADDAEDGAHYLSPGDVIRAAALGTATAAARQTTHGMRSDNQRMLAAARTGLQKTKNAA